MRITHGFGQLWRDKLISGRVNIGFYPVYGLTEVEEEVSQYRAKKTKDSLHFMLDKPLPIELIKKIITLKSKL